MHDINFFSSYIEVSEQKGKSTYRLAAVIGILAALIIVVPLYFEIRIIMNNSVANQCANYLESEAALQSIEKIKDAHDRKAIIDLYKQQLDALLNRAEYTSSISGNILRELAAQMPEGLFINNISLNGSTLNMTGVGKDRLAIAKFEHNMKKDDKFMKVYISSISASGGINENNNGYNFTLTCAMTVKE